MVEYPCRARPQHERCDRHGPGGFMGHTCDVLQEMERQRDIASRKVLELLRKIRKLETELELHRRLGHRL